MAITQRALVGSILGTAVGDALGLPFEGLSPRRAARVFGEPTTYRLLPGWGMVSDDTEHACMVAQALIAAGDDMDVFSRQLARRLRLWLLGIPAGIGLATLRATTKLWLGIPPSHSGVFSAGNGPAMRSAILGVAIEDLHLLKQFIRASTRMTHTDPKAEFGALAVALAARLASAESPVEPARFADELQRWLPDENAVELHSLVNTTIQSIARAETTVTFAASLGLGRGVTGYVYHTVPVALHAWLSHPCDLRTAIVDVVRCGGDTDSTAAIVGGIVGSTVGKDGIPQEWLNRLCEWPRTVAWMERLAGELYGVRTSGAPRRPPRLRAYGILSRNICFTMVVLAHGIRRLMPPY
jgi:ADP-ribosyl-[dinitrogen reductase] hydrolase